MKSPGPLPRKAFLRTKQRKVSLPNVVALSMSAWDPLFATREHTAGCNEIVHIVGGNVTLRIDGMAFRGRPGDTLIVPAGTTHLDEFPLGSDFEVLHIEFMWQEAKKLLPPEINRELVRLAPADKQVMKEMAFDTYDVFKQRRALWEEMINAALYRLLLFMTAAAKERRTPKTPRDTKAREQRRKAMVQEAKDYIRDNMDRHMTLSDIATHLGISACHLSHIFSKESGFTLSSFLTQVRMQKAAELLGDPAAQVAEVAYAVGYEDANYFSKAFRRHFGYSPSRYRARK
jgi:AraC-like DNA-binding protein